MEVNLEILNLSSFSSINIKHLYINLKNIRVFQKSWAPLNMSKTIKEITMHLMYSESLQSQVFYRMFKDVQCEHR